MEGFELGVTAGEVHPAPRQKGIIPCEIDVYGEVEEQDGEEEVTETPLNEDLDW